jgi:hypothetical protein
MSTLVSPIKVDIQVDQLISDTAHFLGRTKKDLVSDAVREYVEAHRAEINVAIRGAMSRLDGSNTSAITVMTGFSKEELDDLGGVPEGK